MDGEIGKAISAGVQGKISAGDTVGLVSMGLLGNAILAPGTPEQPKTPAQIEAEKIAAEKAALERERRQREREAKKDESVAPMIALLDPVPSGETPVHPVGYDKGYEHASQCISQNSGPACAGEKESCISDYRAGYEAGVKDKAIRLEEALQAGLAAGKSGGLADGGADSRASGPCRVEWIESYNRGYFQGKHSKAGK